MNSIHAASNRIACCPALSAVFLVLLSGNVAWAQTTQETTQNIRLLATQAESDLHAQKLPEAVAAYRRLLALDPHNTNAHSNLGLAYYLERDYAHAAPEFQIALRARPELWNIVALCGLSEAQLGQNEIAMTHLREGLNQVYEPSLRLAVGRQLFTILMQKGDFTHAATVIDELRELDPRNPDVLYAEHQVYAVLANEAFVSLSQAAPGSPRMYELQGDEMAQVGKISGALAAYRLAIASDPHLSGVHFALGEALSASHSLDEQAQAESEYRLALVDNPLDEQSLCRLGRIERRRSNWQAASADLHRALELQPGDPAANEELGIVLMSTGLSANAVEYLNRAVQADPLNDSAYYHLSLACRNVGDAPCAVRSMEQFQKLKTKRDDMERMFLRLRNASVPPEETKPPTSIDVEPDKTPQTD